MNKFWAHFKVELKLVKSCLGEFWITGFIWLSYSSNDTFIVSKTYLQCIYIDREECVSVSAFYNSNTVFWVLKNVNPIPSWLDWRYPQNPLSLIGTLSYLWYHVWCVLVWFIAFWSSLVSKMLTLFHLDCTKNTLRTLNSIRDS